MKANHDVNRRLILTALAGLTLVNIGPASAAALTGNRSGNGSALVLFFSRSGNTRVIAGVIHRALKTDMFEVTAAVPYPADYFETVAQATKERESGVMPALASGVKNIGQYQTLYLGFPVWGTTLPPVIQRFLSLYDLSGKHIIPFITHGGYGPGNCVEKLSVLAAGSSIAPPLIMACDQERRTTETVNTWLTGLSSQAGGLRK